MKGVNSPTNPLNFNWFLLLTNLLDMSTIKQLKSILVSQQNELIST